MSDLFHELVPDAFIAEVFAVMALTPWHTYQVLTKRPERMHDFLTRPVEPDAGWLPGSSAAWLIRDALVSEPEWLMSSRLTEEQYAEATVRSGAVDLPLPNVWLGTSVEDQRVIDRVLWLMQTPAAMRFLSCEPLLGPLDLRRIQVMPATPPYGPAIFTDALTGYYTSMDEFHRDERIHWVITGGESGPRHRPFDPQWARDIRDQCQAAHVPFFFKQNGGRTPKSGGRLLDGREWNEMPEVHA
jgi:protein gp37